MANKKKNIPKDLLIEAIEESRGIVADVVRYIGRFGHNCHRNTVNEYIEMYGLEDFLQQQRITMADNALGRLYDKVEEGDNFAINLVLSSQGDKIGFIPNRAVKDYDHKHKIELQENEEKGKKEAIEEYRKIIEDSNGYPFED